MVKPHGFVLDFVGIFDKLEKALMEQRVVAHRFVQIHRVEYRRIETGQQLFGHDQNLRPLSHLGEVLANLLFFLLVEVPLLQVLGVVVVAREDDLGIFRRQNLVERLLVEGAGLGSTATRKAL